MNPQFKGYYWGKKYKEGLTWKILYLTWLISMQVFSAAGLFWSSDLNLEETEGLIGTLRPQI